MRCPVFTITTPILSPETASAKSGAGRPQGLSLTRQMLWIKMNDRARYLAWQLRLPWPISESLGLMLVSGFRLQLPADVHPGRQQVLTPKRWVPATSVGDLDWCPRSWPWSRLSITLSPSHCWPFWEWTSGWDVSFFFLKYIHNTYYQSYTKLYLATKNIYQDERYLT